MGDSKSLENTPSAIDDQGIKQNYTTDENDRMKEESCQLSLSLYLVKPDNVNDHRAAVIDLQAEKAARPADPCASYCYHARDSSNGLLTLRQLQQRKCQPDHWTYDAP